jgi:hypothetical protein
MAQTPGHILTFSGDLFDVANPDPNEIRIEVIAHALSNECRFGGHSRSFYSVAQHSFYVSYMVDERLALAALLHDASEAYLKDLPRPVKALFPEYKKLETRIARVIERSFGLPRDIFEHRDIKMADSRIQAMEGQVLMVNPDRVYDWCGGRPDQSIYQVLDNNFRSMLPKDAEAIFIQRYKELQEDRI